MGAFQSQPNGYSCGVLVVSNALNALGIPASYEDIKRVSGCTSRYGTTREGVIRALVEFGATGTPYRTRKPDNAWKFVRRWAATTPLICLVDSYQHYFLVSGVIGDRVMVVDSGAYITGNEMGAFPYDKQQFLDRLVHRGMCYLIRVSK
jgi:hypothetical protein